MNPIGIYQYNMLKPDDQALTLWESGVFIMNRKEDKYQINLYSLFDFYVEVWYDSMMNSIKKFRTFKAVDVLEPYLDRINLNLNL